MNDDTEFRINSLFDLGIDRRTNAEQEELEELMALSPPWLDPDPEVFPTPFGLRDANGVDVTLIESQLRLTPVERLRRLGSAAREQMRLGMS